MFPSFKDNKVLFNDFVSAQLKNVCSNEKLYLETKCQIQKILKKAKFKMISYN